VGSRVVTAKGNGRVVAQEILVQKLLVEYEDHRRMIVEPGEILSALPPKGRTTAAPDADEIDVELDEAPLPHRDYPGPDSNRHDTGRGRPLP
jgi:hypothetical protein